jgi:hypothetical protein
MPRFSFFTPHSKEPVTADSRIWHVPIPLRRDTLIQHQGQGHGGRDTVSHAAYFEAARSFLEAQGFDVITRAASRQLDRNVKASEIKEIHICLEKHGEFYHPARIEIIVDQKKLCFVLNVAATATGRRFIEREYHLLNRLTNEWPLHYLPRVYGFSRIAAPGGQNFEMFLGQWFDGYHEFHISIDPVDKKPKIRVWDDARGRFFLSAEQTQTLYAQASYILTAYYNLESFEQIFSWHHAAGDFIVMTEKEKLQLRLVTVRQYAAIFDYQKDSQIVPGDPRQILPALLIFFLNLSIRMRLDRIDGIGEMVWSDRIAVDATLTGFLEALSMKPNVPSLPDSPLACFMAYLASCTRDDLLDLTEAMVKRFNPQTPGMSVVRENWQEHVEVLYRSIQQILTL